MLQAAGLVVNFVPGVAERLYQPGFEQAVVTQHFQRGALAGGREGDALVLMVVHQGRFRRSQLLHHARDRSGLDPQSRCQVGGAGGLPIFGQFEDMLQVVLNGVGEMVFYH